MIGVPTGWTDVLHAPREELEAKLPGIYDQIHQVAEAVHMQLMAIDLRQDSPSVGATMLLQQVDYPAPVDEHFLTNLIEHNTLGRGPGDTVEKKLLSVRGRPVAKWLTEYDEPQGNSGRTVMLLYYFAADSGEVMQLMFVVRAEVFAKVRPQLETIEGGDPAQAIILEHQPH